MSAKVSSWAESSSDEEEEQHQQQQSNNHLHPSENAGSFDLIDTSDLPPIDERSDRISPLPSPHPSQAAAINPNGPFIGIMMNIKYSATSEDLQEFFHNGQKIETSNIEMVYEGERGFVGRAIITFPTLESFQQFLDCNNRVSFFGNQVITKVYEIREKKSFSRNGSRNNFRDGPGSSSSKGRGGGGMHKSTSREFNPASDPNSPYFNVDKNVPGSGNGRELRRVFSKDGSVGENSANGKSPRGPPGNAGRGGRGGGEKKDFKKKDSGDAGDGHEIPKERPRIQLAPRTLPVETIGKLDKTAQVNIFGQGKPQDETEYEARRRQQLEQQQQSKGAEDQTADGLDKAVEEKLAIAVPEAPADKAEVAPPQPPTNETDGAAAASTPTDPVGQGKGNREKKNRERKPKEGGKGGKPREAGENGEKSPKNRGDRREKGEGKKGVEKTGEKGAKNKGKKSAAATTEAAPADDYKKVEKSNKNGSKPTINTSAGATKGGKTVGKSPSNAISVKNAFAGLDSDDEDEDDGDSDEEEEGSDNDEGDK